MTVFETVALVFSLFGFGLAVWSIIEVKAMQRSTHQVQFINPLSGEVTSKEEMQKANGKRLQEVYDNL